MDTGREVVVFDNLSSGKMEFIEHHLDKTNFSLIKGDLLNTDEIDAACEGADFVHHAAANPDVRLGAVDSKVHFDQNITATYNLLEAIRKNGVTHIMLKRNLKDLSNIEWVNIVISPCAYVCTV